VKRREFIVALLLSAAAPAKAQQKQYRIAAVIPSGPVTYIAETGPRSYSAFFQRLRELGYVEGQNLSVERYSAEGKTENFAELADEVVRSKPDLIWVLGSRLSPYVKAATTSIPIVANTMDPGALGISNLARPSGNITGVSAVASEEMGGKRLTILREVVPGISKVGFLASRSWWEGPNGVAIREAAKRIKISIIGPPLDPPFDEPEFRRVLAAMVQAGAEALVIGEQNEVVTNGRLVIELVAEARLPALYAYRELTEVGGLMSYGTDLTETFRHTANQVDHILKGTKPGDIPFYQAATFELTINLKTARALGLTVPDALLARADEVIE
jgi:putative ABC transport system substrate-binding protein